MGVWSPPPAPELMPPVPLVPPVAPDEAVGDSDPPLPDPAFAPLDPIWPPLPVPPPDPLLDVGPLAGPRGEVPPPTDPPGPVTEPTPTAVEPLLDSLPWAASAILDSGRADPQLDKASRVAAASAHLPRARRRFTSPPPVVVSHRRTGRRCPRLEAPSARR